MLRGGEELVLGCYCVVKLVGEAVGDELKGGLINYK